MLYIVPLRREMQLVLQHFPGLEDFIKKTAVYSVHQLVRSAAYIGEKTIVEFFPNQGRKLFDWVSTTYRGWTPSQRDVFYAVYGMILLPIIFA